MGHVSFDLARRLRSASGAGGDVVALPRAAPPDLPDPAAGPVSQSRPEVRAETAPDDFDPAAPGRATQDPGNAEGGAAPDGPGIPGELPEAHDEPGRTAPVDDPAVAVWPTPSWEEIVEQHSARVFRLAYRLTGNRHDAEDLTQDVFVRVFRALPTFTPGNFEAWIHRITTNLFLDGARRRQRIRFDALDPEAGERLPDPAAGPEEHYHLTNLDGDVRAALLALRPEFRAAVVLADIEGLPYEEVATALGIKLGTVRSRIHRGRAQLREQLAHHGPTGRAPGVPAGGTTTAPDGAGPAPIAGGRVGSLVPGVGVALGT